LFFTSGVSREKWYWAGSAGSPTLAEHLYAGGAPRDRVREQRMADAAADVKRFDEQLVQVERARRIAGREHDDHHLPVPRTNRAEERWWLRRTDARCPR